MAIGDQNVEPAIVIDIHEAHAPAQQRVLMPSPAW